MLRRLTLFILVNFLVVVTIGLVVNFLGLRPYLNSYGIDYSALLIFCLIWGMGGSFISLLLSRKMAKWMMGVRLVGCSDPLFQMVDRLSREAGLSRTPEVGIYQSADMNAFATGSSERSALVAVSSGLLQNMNERELQAIIGHELTHISNGDMVTLTLLQGVVNAFVMFLARVLALLASGFGNNRERGERGGSFMSYYLFTTLFEIVFMLLGSMVVCAFSRWREYRADAGGAMLSSRDAMISALQVLERRRTAAKIQGTYAPLMISGSSVSRLFASHPPLAARIERLRTI